LAAADPKAPTDTGGRQVITYFEEYPVKSIDVSNCNVPYFDKMKKRRIDSMQDKTATPTCNSEQADEGGQQDHTVALVQDCNRQVNVRSDGE
jgi:hypothetical protein